MLIKLTITQFLMGLFEKLFRLHDPQTPLYQECITISYLPKGPARLGSVFATFFLKQSAAKGLGIALSRD